MRHELMEKWNQWAVQTALMQRYQMILIELGRREKYYDKLRQVENARLFCSFLALVGLLIIMMVLWNQHKTMRLNQVPLGTFSRSRASNEFPTDSDEEDEESSLMWMKSGKRDNEEFFHPLESKRNSI